MRLVLTQSGAMRLVMMRPGIVRDLPVGFRSAPGAERHIEPGAIGRATRQSTWASFSASQRYAVSIRLSSVTVSSCRLVAEASPALTEKLSIE